MLLHLLVASLAAGTVDQDSVRVGATLSADQIVAGESTVLEISVETRGEAPQSIRLDALPAGFEIVGTQDFSQIRTGLSGGRIQSTSRSWVLAGRVPGSFLLPAASVTVGGRVYRTDPLPVVVLAAPAGPAPPGSTERVQLEARAEPDRVYVGQQITFIAEAVFPRELRQRQTRPATYQAPNPSGFWAQDLPDPLVIGVRATGGQIYDTQTFRRAYFPLLPGRHVIPPAMLSYEYRPSLGSPPEARDLASDSLVVTVLPLPDDGRPESFTGAVGRYSVRARIEPRLVRTGEAATLTVTVIGTGNVKSLPAPRLPDMSGLEVLAPSEHAEVEAASDPLGGTKTFEWVVVARDPGRFALAPIEYAFFDPARGTYAAERSDSLVLEVSGTSATTDPGIELRPLRGRPSGDPLGWVRSPAFAFAQVLPLLLVLGVIWSVRKPAGSGKERAHESRARRFAELRAEALAPTAPFWGSLAEAIRTSVGEILDRPDLSAAHAVAMRAALQRAGIPGPTCSAVADLLESLDRIRFAPGEIVPADAPAYVDRAERLMTALARTIARRPGTRSGPVTAMLAVAVPVSLALAQQPFDRAVEAFRGARYGEAASAFAEYLEANPRDADGWYDAGNAYYLSGQGPRAIGAWIRALTLRPRHRDARRNLAAASRSALAHVPPAWALTAEEAAVGLALTWWIAALLVASRLRRRQRIAAVPAVAGAVAVLVVALGLAGSVTTSTGVALAPETAVRADPAFKADELQRVGAGSPVTIIDRRQGWTRVRTGSGTEGWVESAQLVEVGAAPARVPGRAP